MIDLKAIVERNKTALEYQTKYPNSPIAPLNASEQDRRDLLALVGEMRECIDYFFPVCDRLPKSKWNKWEIEADRLLKLTEGK